MYIDVNNEYVMRRGGTSVLLLNGKSCAINFHELEQLEIGHVRHYTRHEHVNYIFLGI